jgi:hypothetical protein
MIERMPLEIVEDIFLQLPDFRDALALVSSKLTINNSLQANTCRMTRLSVTPFLYPLALVKKFGLRDSVGQSLKQIPLLLPDPIKAVLFLIGKSFSLL